MLGTIAAPRVHFVALQMGTPGAVSCGLWFGMGRREDGSALERASVSLLDEP